MGKMPFIAKFEPDTHQIRPDAPRAEKVRYVIGEFARLRHRAPAARLAGHRADELGMAIPATLAQIHIAPRCSSGVYAVAFVMHPFELTEIGADHRGHLSGARRGLEKGQEALGDERQEEKENARDQGNESRAHQAAPPAGTGAAPNAGRSASLAGLVNAVIIRLMTRSDIPISMLMPPTVRTSQ